MTKKCIKHNFQFLALPGLCQQGQIGESCCDGCVKNMDEQTNGRIELIEILLCAAKNNKD